MGGEEVQTVRGPGSGRRSPRTKAGFGGRRTTTEGLVAGSEPESAKRCRSGNTHLLFYRSTNQSISQSIVQIRIAPVADPKKILKRGLKTIQLRPHLSQMRTTKYMLFTRQTKYQPIGEAPASPPPLNPLLYIAPPKIWTVVLNNVKI